MLELALMGSAFLMGMAGSVHCVSMCAAPCAAVTGGAGRSSVAFQVGRLTSYSAAGAVAASSIGLLWQWEQAAAWLRPLWLALHLAVLALGLWLLWRGEQPLWMQRRWGRTPSVLQAGGAADPDGRRVGSLAGRSGGGAGPADPNGDGRGAGHHADSRAGVRSILAGLAWVAWPCGLLQSALLVAALATGPWTGALVMSAFAIGSSPGLWAGPWLLRRLAQTRGGSPDGRPDMSPVVSVIRWGGRAPAMAGGPALVAEAASGAAGLRWATRLSGFLLSAAALWALGHGLWVQIRAYCG